MQYLAKFFLRTETKNEDKEFLHYFVYQEGQEEEQEWGGKLKALKVETKNII